MFTVYGADGQVIKAPDAAGSLTLKVGDNPKEFRIKLQSLKNNSVGAAIDLSKTKVSEADVKELRAKLPRCNIVH